MADVFISYSRKDKPFVEKLHKALAARELDIWVDWEDIPPTAEWLAEIYAAIEAADTFVFVISPDSVKSPVCRQEIEHAAKHNKRLVPIVCADMTAATVPDTLARLNWIFFRPADDFDAAFQTLLQALDTDLAWVRMHTRLTMRAVEWTSKNRNTSFLLRGKDLQEAEQWLIRSAGEDPQPTPLHVEYITLSRAAEIRRKRITLAIMAIGSVVVMVLMLVAFSQTQVAQNEAAGRATQQAIAQTESNLRATQQAVAGEQQALAEQQSSLADSRRLSAQALDLLDSQIDLAMLLGVEANLAGDSFEARNALLTSLLYSPHLEMILRGHTEPVQDILFSADSRQLISAGWDGTIRRWDTATGQSVAPPLISGTMGINSIALSPEGDLLASGNLGGEAVVWDLRANRPIQSFRDEHGNSTEIIGFSPSGQMVLSTDFGGDGCIGCIGIRAWRIDDTSVGGETIATYPDNPFARGPDGWTLATKGRSSQSITLLDISAGQAIGQPMTGHTDSISSLAFSPDGKRLASGSFDQTIRLWDVSTQQPVGQPLIGHTATVNALAFSPDGHWLASGGFDKVIRVWDVQTGLPVDQPWIGHTGGINRLAFSPDGSHLASASDDGTIILWRLKTQPSAGRVIYQDGGEILDAALEKQDNNLQATWITANGVLTRWDLARDQLVSRSSPQRPMAVDRARFSLDGHLLATALRDDTGSTISFSDSTTGQPIHAPLQLPGYDIYALAFSSDNRWLVTGACGAYAPTNGRCISYQALLWDLASSSVNSQSLPYLGTPILEFAFGSDNSRLAAVTGSPSSKIVLWNLGASGAPSEKPLGSPGFSATGLALGPDGQHLAVSGLDNKLRVFDLNEEPPANRPLIGSAIDVTQLAYAPVISQALLATGHETGTLRLWDIPTARSIGLPMSSGMSATVALRFSPDGQQLLSANEDGAVMVWDVSPASWQAQACDMVRRNLSPEEWNLYMGKQTYHKTCSNLP